MSKICIDWISPNISLLDNLKVSEHISIASYFRVLIPNLLPANYKKAIYLDADMIVQRDISKLWNQNIEDYHLLAAQDMATPL